MLEKIEDAYARQFGVPPFNVSYWDPSDEFITGMLSHLEVPTLGALVSYRFSYQIKEVNPVILKLGGVADLHGGLFTPSSTSSILCVLNWLKSRKKTKIIAMCPAYFSLFQACRRFSLTIQGAYMKRRNGGFALPSPDSRIWREPSVLWLTSPVYSAGVYFSTADVLFLGDLLKSGWTVIADECLALPGHELIRKLGQHPNFVSIYSPHKGVCINGIKFSAILFNQRHLGFMERWADVWYGGIGYSSSLAIQHFLSSNFDVYLARFLQTIAQQQKMVGQLCAGDHIEMDDEALGHFVSCYFPTISSRLGNSRRFLEQLVNTTGGSIITGNRSRFSREVGFSFRINLARGGPRFQSSLARIVGYVSAQAIQDFAVTA
jgi:hypothetical protein